MSFSFSHGSGLGSASRGSAFKSALAGAAIGGLAGVAVGGLIAHAANPFTIGGRPYYWGQEYYQAKNGQFMCSMPFQDLAKLQTNTTTANGTATNGTDPLANVRIWWEF